jgi:O-antigen ligase
LSGVRPSARAAAGRWLSFIYAAPITTAALAFVIACLFLTGSRAGLASLAGAFLLFFALIRPRAAPRWGPDAAIWMIAAISGVLLLVAGDFLLGRLMSVDIDADARRLMIESHWKAFLDRPLFGHGLNTFHEINLHYTDMETWRALNPIGAAHNVFVQTLEENGVFGAALFALMLAPPLWRAFQIVRMGAPGAEWAAAALAAFVFAFTHGLVDFGMQVPATAATLAYALGAFAGAAEKPVAARQPAVAGNAARGV